MTELFTSVVSIAATKRRRFLWAAWWSAPPTEDPFRKPDASSGGARTREEAIRAAEAVAGRPLTEVDPRWAVAWFRVLRGHTPWPSKQSAPREANEPRPSSLPREGGAAWAHGVLGVPRGSSAADLKKAFRVIALETHPDRGGNDAAFIRAKQAYDVAVADSKGKKRAKKP